MKIIDLHCDTLSILYDHHHNGNKYSLLKNNGAVDLNKLKQGNFLLQCFAIFIAIKKVSNPYLIAIKTIEIFKNEILKNNKLIQQVFNYQDILNISSTNKIAALLTIEDGAITNYSFDNLQSLYDYGVRMITLTWNYETKIGFPNKVSENKTDDENGLTDYGIQFIQKLNELGIIIDVSHLSDKGFYDVLKYSKKPFIASHSNSRTCCNSVRNLTDDMIIQLDKIGGVMGLNYVEGFLSSEKCDDYIDVLVKHIKHIKKIASINVICLGSDFDGALQNRSLKNASYLPLLVKRLHDNHFSQEEIEKITSKNALRLFKTILN